MVVVRIFDPYCVWLAPQYDNINHIPEVPIESEIEWRRHSNNLLVIKKPPE